MTQSIRGSVATCIYKNEQSGFGIFKIVLFNSADKSMVIKGDLLLLEMECAYEFMGEYENNPRYGLQFNVATFAKVMPRQREFIVRYLSGPSFPGIGIKTAEKIVDIYGESVLDDIMNQDDFSLKAAGLSKNKEALIVETIMQENPNDNQTVFFMTHGLSAKQIQKILATYGENAQALLQDNPYRLVYDVEGIGFKTADKLAHLLGFSDDDPLRIEAKVLDSYKNYVFGRGDSYCELAEFLNFEALPEWKQGIQALIARGELILDEDRLYHITQYESEVEVAEFLHSFKYQGQDFMIADVDDKIDLIEDNLRLIFDAQQRETIHNFLTEDIMILTGGPGTGKSTLLAGVVMLLQETCPWLKISLCAPTGRAAKRLEALTNVQATTIHSLLKWNLETNTFGMHEDNPLETDVLIIDEFSMMDVWIFANLLKASDNVKKFLFVGDKDQLPSVGSGYVLGDLMAAHRFKTIVLTHNYRQEKGSEVIDCALNVNAGVFDASAYENEVHFFESNAYHVKTIVLTLVERALEIGYDLNDIQVLAPIYAGNAGIDTLNHFLQEQCNPPSPQKQELFHSNRIFREGDKVLQLKNQPDDFVFNGDIGMIVEIVDREVMVDFSGNYVAYDNVDLINLDHAYCISVHKSQGSEYPFVILIAVQAFYKMLSRKLYYTGMTRSSKYLMLVGEETAFTAAATHHEEVKRRTYLRQRLELKAS